MPTRNTHSNSPINIVFLEDDSAFAAGICQSLEALNYKVSHFATGYACLSHLVNHNPDICLFDWNVPDMAGTYVMERLREINRMPPVIFMTGNDAERDVADVLMAGADDYIIKPPVIAVLHARIQALLRRSQERGHEMQKEEIARLSIDYENKVISLDGTPVALTGTEAILAFDLFMQRGRIVTRQHLYELLGINGMAINTRLLDVHISHLRTKLALNVANGWKLTSIYRRGYRLEYQDGE